MGKSKFQGVLKNLDDQRASAWESNYRKNSVSRLNCSCLKSQTYSFPLVLSYDSVEGLSSLYSSIPAATSFPLYLFLRRLLCLYLFLFSRVPECYVYCLVFNVLLILQCLRDRICCVETEIDSPSPRCLSEMVEMSVSGKADLESIQQSQV